MYLHLIDFQRVEAFETAEEDWMRVDQLTSPLAPSDAEVSIDLIYIFTQVNKLSVTNRDLKNDLEQC